MSVERLQNHETDLAIKEVLGGHGQPITLDEIASPASGPPPHIIAAANTLREWGLENEGPDALWSVFGIGNMDAAREKLKEAVGDIQRAHDLTSRIRDTSSQMVQQRDATIRKMEEVIRASAAAGCDVSETYLGGMG
jgi:hypothetical protein